MRKPSVNAWETRIDSLNEWNKSRYLPVRAPFDSCKTKKSLQVGWLDVDRQISTAE